MVKERIVEVEMGADLLRDAVVREAVGEPSFADLWRMTGQDEFWRRYAVMWARAVLAQRPERQ